MTEPQIPKASNPNSENPLDVQEKGVSKFAVPLVIGVIVILVVSRYNTVFSAVLWALAFIYVLYLAASRKIPIWSTVGKSRWLVSALLVALGFVCIPILLVISTGHFPRYGRTAIEVDPSEMPMYPKAQNVVYEEPAASAPEKIRSWTFTTVDNPEAVWTFYVAEMSRKWSFFEYPLLPEFPRRLIVRSCPSHEFVMTSTPMGPMSHRITIRLRSHPCE